MQPDLAIRRLSFAEARSSGSEALVNMVQLRQEMLDAVAAGNADAKTEDMLDRTRDERRHHAVDKTA
jgi:hypothetical protein